MTLDGEYLEIVEHMARGWSENQRRAAIRLLSQSIVGDDADPFYNVLEDGRVVVLRASDTGHVDDVEWVQTGITLPDEVEMRRRINALTEIAKLVIAADVAEGDGFADLMAEAATRARAVLTKSGRAGFEPASPGQPDSTN